jgi:GNAT superfamily N-acetyltransferase
MAKIVAVTDKNLLAKFIDFPHELYKNDPYYVPELFIAQRDMLTPGKHPFHDHAKLQLFLAVDNDKVVGRVAGIINGNHNNTNNVKEGFFGFFDVIDDKDTSHLLLNAAMDWLKKNDQTKVMGPVNFSTNDICGLLIKGFDGPPVAMMPYNAPYYLSLLEDFGFKKKVDLRAYKYTAGNYNDRSAGLVEALENRLTRSNITIRKIDLKKFKEEAASLREVYNKAWDKNLGFVPMTDKEFDYTAKDLKLILDTDFCYIAEQEGKVVGFALAIPDINQVLIKIKKGRLFPTGLIKLLLGKKKINGIRILLLGVVDGYRKLGIEACLYGRIIKAFKARNFQYAEASWTLEDNEMVNRPIENIGGQLYREYRLLEKEI